MLKDKVNFKLLNLLLIIVIIYIIYSTMNFWGGVIGKIISTISPFVIAFGIAYALYPIVRKLKDKGLSNGISVAIVSISILAIITFIIALTVPIVYDQLILLSKSIGDVFNDLSSKFAVNMGDFQTTINNLLDNLIQNVGTYVSTGTFEFVGKSISFLTNAMIVVILSIYFLADMEKIRKEIKAILTSQKRKNLKIFNYVKLLDSELGQYLTGLAIFMGIQFIEYTILFRIVGHPNWLLLGLLASLTTVIPYFGGWITNIVAVILASVVSTPVFIATLVICFVFPNIDGYIISPRVFGKTNNINPVLSIFAVVVGGSLFGLIGIMFSLPIFIVLNCTFKYFKADIYGKISDIREGKEEK